MAEHGVSSARLNSGIYSSAWLNMKLVRPGCGRHNSFSSLQDLYSSAWLNMAELVKSSWISLFSLAELTSCSARLNCRSPGFRVVWGLNPGCGATGFGWNGSSTRIHALHGARFQQQCWKPARSHRSPSEDETCDQWSIVLHMLEHLPVMASLLAAHEAHRKGQDAPVVQLYITWTVTTWLEGAGHVLKVHRRRWLLSVRVV